jgi:hypothetical protein
MELAAPHLCIIAHPAAVTDLLLKLDAPITV